MSRDLALFIPDTDPAGIGWFWRTDNGWVLRLAYRLWLIWSRSEEGS